MSPDPFIPPIDKTVAENSEPLSKIALADRPKHYPVSWSEIRLLKARMRTHGWEVRNIQGSDSSGHPYINERCNVTLSMTELDGAGRPFIGANYVRAHNIAPQTSNLLSIWSEFLVESDKNVLVNLVVVSRSS
jgi:hypothetical protein